jgi:hypothetical protein
MEVAGVTRVAPEQLREMLHQPPVQRDRERGRSEPALEGRVVRPRAAEERDGPELEVLRHVVHDWESVEPWIRYEELFRSDLHAATFRVLMAHPTVQEAIDAADPGVADLIGRLATEELHHDAFDAVVRLLSEWARREVAELKLKAQGDDAIARLEQVAWLQKLAAERLLDPDTAAEAADELVAFVGQQGEEGE